MKQSGLKANLFYNICYQILSLIVPLITSPYISRVLGKIGVGEYSYTYSIAHYFVLFIMLGVLNYGNREIARVKDDKIMLEKQFSGIYSVQLVLGGIVSIVYIISVVFFENTYRSIALIQMLYVASAIFDISWFYFGIEKFKVTTCISTANKLLTTILIFSLVKNQSDINIYTLILAGGVFCNNIAYWVFLRKYINNFKFNTIDLKKHLKPLIILFIPVIAVSIYKYMDKIMIGAMADISEVGIYEAAEKLVNLPLSLITAIGTVMLPRISNLMKQSENSVVKQYNYVSMELIMILSFGIVFGLAGIAQVFVPLFYGLEFNESTRVLIILLPSVLFVSWANVVRTQCLLPNKRDKEYCISVIAGAIVNFSINYALIPSLGAIGAACGTTITEFLVCIIQCLQTRKQMEHKTYFVNCIPYAASAIFMFLLITRIRITSDVTTIIVRILVGGCVYLILSGILMILKVKKKNY